MFIDIEIRKKDNCSIYNHTPIYNTSTKSEISAKVHIAPTRVAKSSIIVKATIVVPTIVSKVTFSMEGNFYNDEYH